MRLLIAICFSFFAARVLALQDSATLPIPPSIAVNQKPIGADVPVRVLTNVIPASAKYVIYANVNLKGLKLDQSNKDEVGANLTKVTHDLANLARQKGANLVVLLSSEHGIGVPIEQIGGDLILRPNDPVLTAYFLYGMATT